MPRLIPYRVILGAVLALPAVAGAATRSWPGAAPCNGTLQACVDAATDGDRIEIASNTPIAEDLSLYNRSLSLVAASGFTPVFAAGHSLSATTSSIAGNVAVTLRGLAFVDGYVYVTYSGTGTGTYDLSQLRLTRSASDSTNYLHVEAFGGTVNATVSENTVTGVPAGLNQGLIELAAHGGALNAQAYNNRVTSTAPTATSGGGIFVDIAGSGSGGTVKLHGNTVRGSFNRAGIVFSEGLFSSTAVSYAALAYNNVMVGADRTGSGLDVLVYNGRINLQALNNTITRTNYGLLVGRWGGAGPDGTGTVGGTIKNNLFVSNTGLAYGDFGITDPLTDDLVNDYNLFNVGGNPSPAGAHDLSAPAQLVSEAQPRLRAGSPAVDAADTTALGLGLIFNGLPSTDADGLRRITGSGGKADIGAYELGGTSFLHTARTNTLLGHISYLSDPAVVGVADADPFVTANYNAGVSPGGPGLSNSNVLGVYDCGTPWCIFNEDTATPITANTHYNVLVAAPGSGRQRVQATTGAGGNTTGTTLTVDASGLNSLPDAVALVTQNWSVGNVYNPHPVALQYDSGAARWAIVNGDGAAMPNNAGFNLYYQQASPNAFRLVAGSGNLVGTQLEIDHPLLNGSPCAVFQVTRVLTPGSSPIANFDVFYASSQRWRIFSYAAAGIAAGDAYNVVIDPAQAFLCSDRIFADGYQ